MPAAIAKRSKAKKASARESLLSYVGKLNKSVNPGLSIGKGAALTVETVGKLALSAMVSEASRSVKASKAGTLSKKHISAALGLAFPLNLGDQLTTAGDKAISKYAAAAALATEAKAAAKAAKAAEPSA